MTPLELVEVRPADGGDPVGGAIVRNVGGLFTIRLVRPIAAPAGRYDVRRLDEGGNAWYARCGGGVLDLPLLLELTRPREWSAAPGRRAARFSAARAALVVQTVVPVGVRRELVALDVSASGCRVTGAGVAPSAGAAVRLTLDVGSYAVQRWIPGNVVRERQGPFGRFELGIRFAPTVAAERELVLAWRDAASRREQLEPGAPVTLVPA